MVADLSTPKPTIVIVPGSFSPSSFYSGVTWDLTRNGYETVVVDLPSIGRRDPLPPATMADDAEYIKSITSKLVDSGKNVVIVTHSYGGIPGTESTKDLAKSDMEALGKQGGISRLIYITSLVPKVGDSLGAMMGPLVPDFISIDGGYMKQEHVASSKVTFSDLPPAEALKFAEQMPEHSTVTFSGELTHPGYKYIPVSYLLCEADVILPLNFQKGIVELIEKESGKAVSVHSCKAAHCPNASVPLEVASIIREAVGEKF